MNMQAYLLVVYSFNVSHPRIFLMYVSLVIFSKFFSILFNMNSQRKYLQYVMLYPLKKVIMQIIL